MAIIGIKEKMTLKLELDNGLVDGKQKVQSKSFNKVKPEAADEDLHGTALALAELQDKDILKVKRIEETALVSE